MAPEQWKDERQDAATDIYALSALFYEMVRGHPPLFEDPDLGILMSIVLTLSPRPIKTLTRDQNHPLMKLLPKDRKKRFKSALEF